MAGVLDELGRWIFFWLGIDSTGRPIAVREPLSLINGIAVGQRWSRENSIFSWECSIKYQEHLMSVDCEDKFTFWKMDASLKTLMDIFGADRIVDTQVDIVPTCIGQVLSCSYFSNLPVYLPICSVFFLPPPPPIPTWVFHFFGGGGVKNGRTMCHLIV